MSFSIYDASAPVFTAALGNMQKWLDKARAEGKDEAALVAARWRPTWRPYRPSSRCAPTPPSSPSPG